MVPGTVAGEIGLAKEDIVSIAGTSGGGASVGQDLSGGRRLQETENGTLRWLLASTFRG